MDEYTNMDHADQSKPTHNEIYRQCTISIYEERVQMEDGSHKTIEVIYINGTLMKRCGTGGTGVCAIEKAKHLIDGLIDGEPEN